MKKLVSIIIFSLFFVCGSITFAGSYSMQITLSRGWNVVSTPAILSSIEFSNGGNGISFSKLENGQWVNVPVNVTNIKPLEGYIVYSSNSPDVTMTFKYQTGITVGQSLLQKNLNYGWNFLGILTASNPFNSITGANMSVDFTNNGSTNLKNKVNTSYTRNTSSKNISNPQLGEAYGVFVNERESIYGGVNNGGTEVPNIDVENEAEKLLACLAKCEASDVGCVLACGECGGDKVVCREKNLSMNYMNNSGVVIIGAVSDLDLINFTNLYGGKISEITLKKYGSANIEDIDFVWLEDENGNKISNDDYLDANGIVTLQIHDGVIIDESNGITIVIKTKTSLSAGDNMIGFKVTSIVVDNQDYSFDGNENPYLYRTALYGGTPVNIESSVVTITPRGSNRTYNRESGQYYEVSKFRVASADNDVLLKGFDLSNSGNLLLTDGNSDIKVAVNGEYVKNLITSISNNKLVINFDNVKIPGGHSSLITVETQLIDFNQYGTNLQYSIDSTGDIRIEEDDRIEPTTSGVIISIDKSVSTWTTYVFEGGKVIFTNVNLGDVEAGQLDTDVEIAEGTITITEPITASFDITANATGINSMKMVLGQNERKAVKEISGSNTIFKFNNIDIGSSGTVHFYVDIKSDAILDSPIQFTTLSHSIITALYFNSLVPVSENSIVGTISFSRLTIVCAKASLQNRISTAVEFPKDETRTITVFNGNYTVTKRDLYLQDVIFGGTKPSDGNNITFYLYIDGQPVVDVRNLGNDSFNSILIRAGDSISVKVDAEVDARTVTNYSDFTITLQGEDKNGNYPVGVAVKRLVTMKIIDTD